MEIVANDQLVDIVAAGFDAGIRHGESLQQDMIAVPIGPAIRFATPAYLAQHGTPTTPQELLQHQCIRQRFPSGQLFRWKYEKNGEAIKVVVTGSLVVADHGLILGAAMDSSVWHTYAAFAQTAIKQGGC